MKVLAVLISAILVCAGNTLSLSEYRNVLYVGDWTIYKKGLKPKDIPFNKITHLVYAFAKFDGDGNVSIADEYAAIDKVFDDSEVKKPRDAAGLVGEFWKAKKAHRHLKTLVAFGGWNDRNKWAPTMKDPKKRANFVASATKLMLDWGMDGIDIDWEYPDTEQANRDAVSLLKELRVALNECSKAAKQYHFLLSFASPADPKSYQNFTFKEMDKPLDFWSIMLYDFAGSWDNTTAHSSNLYEDSDTPGATKFDAASVIVDYKKAGIAGSKINFGMPLYGHVYSGTDGLGKPYHGHPEELENGIIQLKDLPHTPKATEHFDKRAVGVYSYDEFAREFISYENKQSASMKADFVFWLDLGGMMYWDASGDRKGDESIVRHVADEFENVGGLQRSDNNLIYPGSKYANIRNLNGTD